MRRNPHHVAKPEYQLSLWFLIAFTGILYLAPQNYFPVLRQFQLGNVFFAARGGERVSKIRGPTYTYPPAEDRRSEAPHPLLRAAAGDLQAGE